MTVLVTGGAGYIGAHVVRLLVRSGRDVVVVDDLSTGTAERVGGAELVRLDVAAPGSAEALARVLRRRGVTDVVHFAARKRVDESVADPLRYYQQNVDGLGAVLRACTAEGARSVVFSSSAAVYGDVAGGRVREDAPTAPVNPYGRTKLVGEWMLRDVAATGALRAAAGVRHGLRDRRRLGRPGLRARDGPRPRARRGARRDGRRRRALPVPERRHGDGHVGAPGRRRAVRRHGRPDRDRGGRAARGRPGRGRGGPGRDRAGARLARRGDAGEHARERVGRLAARPPLTGGAPPPTRRRPRPVTGRGRRRCVSGRAARTWPRWRPSAAATRPRWPGTTRSSRRGRRGTSCTAAPSRARCGAWSRRSRTAGRGPGGRSPGRRRRGPGR